MFAGKLRHRVTVERLSEVQDEASGEMASAWAPIGTFWAQVEPLSGTELFEAKQITPEITHKVTFRYGTNVTPRDRLIHRERYFEIIAALDQDERRRETVASCKELVEAETG